MATNTKEYGRHYYKAHSDIWRRSYEKNAEARRQHAKEYANRMWSTNPEYRAAHVKRTGNRAKVMRRAVSIAKAATKAFKALERLF